LASATASFAVADSFIGQPSLWRVSLLILPDGSKSLFGARFTTNERRGD
jgi:hypothetical protein